MKPTMVQYTGDLKSLLPAGWRFQKLYAKNYRAYMKDDMLIWQSGRKFRIDNYGDYTSVLIKHIMDHGIESLAYHDTMFGENNVRYWITLDKKNLKVIPFRWMNSSLFHNASDSNKIDEYYAQYREANVSETTMKMLQDFINQGKLTIKEMP